jgi:hypothetical protein
LNFDANGYLVCANGWNSFIMFELHWVRQQFSPLCVVELIAMDTAVNIWNLLWEFQVPIVVLLVLIVWLLVRGSDLGKWIIRKLRGKSKDSELPPTA